MLRLTDQSKSSMPNQRKVVFQLRLVQALNDCPSLQTVDLSQNLLTMDSCSDLCQLITTAPSLSFISLAENLFSLRSVGYFMTAVMERQNTKKLMPLDLLDLQGHVEHRHQSLPNHLNELQAAIRFSVCIEPTFYTKVGGWLLACLRVFVCLCVCVSV